MAGRPAKATSYGPAGRVKLAWDSIKASFGFPSGVAMLAGAILGLGLPALDQALEITVPVLTFDSQSAARGLLETIATTTTAVAGLSFSVTVVAITLASSQLSPRVLRSFRSDRLSQVTLALFLGTFVYSLALLVRLGINGPDGEPPNLSVSLAVLFAFAAFGTFAAFIAHILRMLQPSSVIASIHEDAVAAEAELYPSGPGKPADEARAGLLANSLIEGSAAEPVRAESSGYLAVIDIGPLLDSAEDAGVVVRQSAPIGDYILRGQVIAEILTPFGAQSDESGTELEAVRESVVQSFILARQRTLVQDIAFPVRQLADIALKGLSPGVNDPTTAENAIDAMGSFLVSFAGWDRPCPVRVDEDDEPRFVALAPDLHDLLRLGFEQTRIAAENHPTISNRMLFLLELIEGAADRAGVKCAEIDRQRRLIEPDANRP